MADGSGMLLADIEELIKTALASGTMEERYASRMNPLILVVEYYDGTRFVITEAKMNKNCLVLTMEREF